MKNIRAVIGEKNPKVASCHPGLWLDKFSRSGKEEVQREEINQVCKLSEATLKNDGGIILTEARNRREKNLAAFGADKWSFSAKTTGPFTLHLARASALENAGICLHPVYGFPYIPGSALKGMAHAYACEVWLREQEKKPSAWGEICKVFGWAPSTWLHNLAERYKVKDFIPIESSIGSVIFHDAWPLQWPKLICDIVNNHHPKYYGADSEDTPPGDWEDPKPVYFLAVAPGAEFDFPVSLHAAAFRNQRPEELMRLACLWLLSALEHRGAGAKTNTGYGCFELNQPPAKYNDIRQDSDALWRKATDAEKGMFREKTFTLELVSPAFIAGANQEADDCDLRPSTLRGHLRWWWRTMHAGYLEVKTLKKLEDAIWGSTAEGGAVSIKTTPKTELERHQFDKQKLAKSHKLERPLEKKTAQGLSYIAFGMDDTRIVNDRRIRFQRYYVDPFAQWEITFIGRSVKTPWQIPAETILEQSINAFYLLCASGGIGAKSRNGFGSIAVPENLTILTLDICRESARKLRQFLGIDSPFDEKQMFSPSIDMALERKIPTGCKDFWNVLGHLGSSYKSFLQSESSTGHGKHCEQKLTFGLPRQIHGPGLNPMRHQNPSTHQKPKKLSGPKGYRYSSPFFFHLDRDSKTGNYTIRVTAFPARLLPDLDTSRKMLIELITYLDKDLQRRIKS
jgi:CRISPR-associated protein Cmr6